MKKYVSLGQLLKEYREVYAISQAEFADMLNADIRTIQRWENDQTHIKTEKEVDLAEATLLPFQLIRNLNSSETIATYYDFKTRKYSLSALGNEIPDGQWVKMQMGKSTDRMRTLDADLDLSYIMAYMKIPGEKRNELHRILKLAAQYYPEINLIITDDLGNYAGHSIVFPITFEAYQKLKNRTLKKEDLRVADVDKSARSSFRYFFQFDLTTDCNDNLFYVLGRGLSYFKGLTASDYLYVSRIKRPDSYALGEQLGLKIVWEIPSEDSSDIFALPTRFLEGNFSAFLHS